MVRYYLLGLKILNALLFIWIVSIFLSLFDFNEILTTADNELAILDAFFGIKNILSYFFYFLLFGLAYGISFVIGGLFGFIPGFSFSYLSTFIQLFFKNFLSGWFLFPEGTAPDFFQVPEYMLEELLLLTEDFYLLIFQVLFILAFFYVIRGIIQTDPKHNMFAVGCLVLMIIIPLIFKGFRDMLSLFNLVEPFNSIGIINLNELADPLSPLFDDLPVNDFFAFLGSPVALFAIISYLYLEFSFQINYTDTVTRPSLERSDRLEAQLNLLRKESTYINANLDKIKQEARKKKEELGIEKAVAKKFVSKTGEKKFSYVKEMIEKKRLESEEKQLVEAASKTRRLGRYLERLLREDPEAEDTITARSSTPRTANLAISTVLNSSVRIVLLILISFIIIHPKWFLDILLLPPAITDSVAMFSPEVIVILLLPIIFLFPLIAKIISYIKHRALVMRLKEEGKIKEILTSVGDYVKKEEYTDETETHSEIGISEEAVAETN